MLIITNKGSILIVKGSYNDYSFFRFRSNLLSFGKDMKNLIN